MQGMRGKRIWLAALGLLAMPAAHATRTVTLYFTDPQGTILMEKDAQGHILARHDYRPYGASQGTPAPAGPGYTGHVNDPDTGLVYMQQRYYDAAVGQFASVDPIGPTPGNIYNINRYAYANNNPYLFTDPTGMCGETGEVSAKVQAMRDTADGCAGAMAKHAAATGGGLAQPSPLSQVATPDEYTRSVPGGISGAVNAPLVQSWEKIIRRGHDFNAPPGGTRMEHGLWVYSSKSGKFLLVSMPDSQPDPVTGAYHTIQAGDPPAIAGYHPVLSIHSHPFALPNRRSVARGFTIMAYPQPSQADINYANGHNLPGMVVSHKGNFYYMPNVSPNPTPGH